jgi:hypothetical protein
MSDAGRRVFASLKRTRRHIGLLKQAKALRAVLSLMDEHAMVKKAYNLSARDLERALRDHLRQSEVEIPEDNLDGWGKYIFGAMHKVRKKNGWDEHVWEDVFSNLLTIYTTGHNPLTNASDINTLAENVRKWYRQGKDSQDMKKLTAHKFQSDAKWAYNQLMSQRNPLDKHKPNKGIEQRGDSADATDDAMQSGAAIFEDMYQMSGESQEMSRSHMNFIKRNPEIQRLIDDLDRKIKREAPLDERLIWQAYTREATNPQGAGESNWTVNDVLDTTVEYKDEDGNKHQETLEEAMDRIGGSSTGWYLQEKLQDLVQSLWPDVRDWMQDASEGRDI